MGIGYSSRRTIASIENAHDEQRALPGYARVWLRSWLQQPSIVDDEFGCTAGDMRSILPSPVTSPGTAYGLSNILAHYKIANKIEFGVNMNTASLRLQNDEENPGHHLVAFSFDSNAHGSVSIFFMAKEKAECSLIPLKPKIFTPVLQHFKEGMHQKFIQDSGTGVNLRLFNDVDLSKVGKDNVYPLVVRMDIWTKGQPFDAAARDSEQPGSSLSKSATSQMIHAVIERKNEDYKVRVIQRIIWMDGTRYELYSIYGVSKNENDSEKQCVICMSEPKNTTVFPCRHMCMCNKCAKVIRSQSNLCPICRQPVVKYLELKDFEGW